MNNAKRDSFLAVDSLIEAMSRRENWTRDDQILQDMASISGDRLKELLSDIDLSSELFVWLKTRTTMDVLKDLDLAGDWIQSFVEGYKTSSITHKEILLERLMLISRARFLSQLLDPARVTRVNKVIALLIK